MSRFLAIGECMLEMAACQDGKFKLSFAGDTFNTAWYARQIAPRDWQVAYQTAIGDDRWSTEMLRFMENAGIRPVVKIRKGQSVGLYLISLVAGERSFSYWRGESAARTLADDLESLPQANFGEIIYFSGITLAILPEASRYRLIDFIVAAKRCGGLVAFDPNYRPKLWGCKKEARKWITGSAAVADIVLPSFDDEAKLFGDKDSKETTNRYLVDAHQTIIVKNGGIGVRAETSIESWEIKVEPTIAVDTTAAGDSFNAAVLVWHWINKKPLLESVEFGCRVAREVIASHGALVTMRESIVSFKNRRITH